MKYSEDLNRKYFNEASKNVSTVFNIKHANNIRRVSILAGSGAGVSMPLLSHSWTRVTKPPAKKPSIRAAEGSRITA
jgi:hypothetical protein